MWNPFKKKIEKRDSVVTAPSISLQEQNESALGLIFGRGLSNNNALSISTCFRSINLISSSLASLPIVVYKTDPMGNKVEAKNHPVSKVLKNPNPFMSMYTLIQKFTMDLMIYGNAIGVIHRDVATGKIASIEYIKSGACSLVKKYDKDGAIAQVLYNISGRTRLLEADEVIHLMMIPDETGLWGESVLKFANRSLKLADYNENAAKNSFESGGAISGIVNIKGAITDKSRESIKQAWSKSAGGTNAGSVCVMSGLESFEKISMNSEELQLLESRKYAVDDLSRFFMVSPILNYSLEHSNYSSASAAHEWLLVDTLSDYIYKFISEFTRKLLSETEKEKYEIQFLTSEFTKANQKEHIETLREMYNMGVISPNEMRAALGMPKIDDKNADSFFMQAQMLRLSDFGKEQNKNAVDSVVAGNSNIDTSVNNEEENSKEEEQVPKDSSTGTTENNNEE